MEPKFLLFFTQTLDTISLCSMPERLMPGMARSGGSESVCCFWKRNSGNPENTLSFTYSEPSSVGLFSGAATFLAPRLRLGARCQQLCRISSIEQPLAPFLGGFRGGAAKTDGPNRCFGAGKSPQVETQHPGV